VTYGGTPLVRAVSAVSGTSSWRACNGVFYLLSPPPGTANVAVTFPATTGTPIDNRHATAFVLYNAAQRAPEAVAAEGANATTNPIATSIAAASAGAWVVDVVTQGETGTFTPTQAGQVERSDVSCTSSSSAVSTKQAPAPGSTALGWSHSKPRRYAHALAAFAPAPVLPPTTTTTLPPVPCQSNADCDDADACTSDLCASGTCGHTDVSAACADTDPCTNDACDPAQGCVSVPHTGACDDGLFCTVGDTCAGGTCSGTPRNCADAHACTADACSEAADACTHAPSDAACNDGNACTQDVCSVTQGCTFTNTCTVEIAIDPASAKSACAATGADTITVGAVPVGSQPDRVLVVTAGAEEGNADCNLAHASASAKYGALNMTLATAAVSDTSGSRTCNAIFYLLSPPAGTQNVVVTFPNAKSSTIDNRQAAAFVLYNVAQQAPQPVGAFGADAATNPVTNSITTAADAAWVVDVITRGDNGSSTTTQSDQTERFDLSCGSSSSATSTRRRSPAGATAMGWSHTDPQRWAHALAAFAPATSGGGALRIEHDAAGATSVTGSTAAPPPAASSTSSTSTSTTVTATSSTVAR
jgi:hypothetical protein